MEMKIVGLAGESGTGKSMIAAHLTTRGGAHVETDLIGHDVLEKNEEARQLIRERIGADVFEADGHINRRRLGNKVFTDEALRAEFNGIVHPAIRRECGRQVEKLRETGVPFVVIDGALLLSSVMPFAWDLMIALFCEEEEQVARLMAKGGRTEQEVRDRLASQRAIRESFDRADVEVDTCRPKDEVLAEIDALIDDLLLSP
jgi:dephospho-CoA kinase